MNAKRLVAAGVISVLFVAPAGAAFVDFIVWADQDAEGRPAPGQFRITVRVSGGDNAGLAGYGVDLVGNILTLDHRSPRDTSAEKDGVMGPTGFNFGRSADSNVSFISGFQDVSDPNVIPVYSFGQTDGSFEANGIAVGGSTLEGNPWQAELLLATGTSPNPCGVIFGLNMYATVFVSASSKETKAAEHVGFFWPCFPEPSTAVIAAGTLLIAPLFRKGRMRQKRMALELS